MIRILDDDFNIIQTIPYHTSFVWTRRFSEGGSFSFSLPIDFITDISLMDKIIYYQGTYGIIQYINISEDSIEIKGFDLKGILAFRQANIKDYSGSVETVIKDIVRDNTAENRAFPNFMIGEDKQTGQTINYSVLQNDTVENVLKNLSEQYNIGYDITVKDKKMVFDVFTPNDSNVVYSSKKMNISGFEYNYDKLDNSSVVINHGHADPVKMDAYYKDTRDEWIKINGKICFPNGDIREVEKTLYTLYHDYTYVYAYLDDNNDVAYSVNPKTISDTENKYVYIGKVYSSTEDNAIVCTPVSTENQYIVYLAEQEPTGFQRKECSLEINEGINNIKNESEQKLKQEFQDENISADIIPGENYKILWNIGDYITVKIVIMGEKLELKKQVTEVQEVYEHNSYKIIPKFGNNKDNIIRKMIKGRM